MRLSPNGTRGDTGVGVMGRPSVTASSSNSGNAGARTVVKMKSMFRYCPERPNRWWSRSGFRARTVTISAPSLPPTRGVL